MCTMYPTKERRPCPQESMLLDVYGTIIVQMSPRAETRVMTITGQPGKGVQYIRSTARYLTTHKVLLYATTWTKPLKTR